MAGDYPQFPARVDRVDTVVASDTDTMNTALGRARSGRWSILASNGVGDGATDASSALTSMDGSNGGAGVSELAAGTWRVANSISLSHALAVPPGATFKPDSGKTLTLSGPIDAGPYQIFDLSAGGLVAFGRGAMRTFKAAWWGFSTGNTAAANGAALSAAYTAVSAVGGVIELPAGNFPCQDVTVQPYVTLQGAGGQEVDLLHSTILVGVAGHDMLTMPSGLETDFYGFCDFGIYGGRHGIVSPYLSTLVRIARVTVSGHSGAGFSISGAIEEWHLDNIYVQGGAYGFQANYGLVSGRNFIDKCSFRAVRTTGQSVSGWDIQCVESSSVTWYSPVIINSAQHGFHADGGISGWAIHNLNTEGNGNGRSPAATYSTGSISASSGSLTSASSAYQNGDVLTVAGAGANGTDLTTTVSSGGGTTSLTVSPTASTTVTNAAVTNAIYDDVNLSNAHATPQSVCFFGGLSGSAGANLRYAVNGAGANHTALYGMGADGRIPFYDPNMDGEVWGGSVTVRRLLPPAQELFHALAIGSQTATDTRIPTGYGKNWIAALTDSAGNTSGTFGAFEWYKSDSGRTLLATLANDGSFTPLRVVNNWQTANPAGATPSVAGANNVWMRQSGATNVTNFTGGKDGQVIYLLFTDANSTIVHGTNIFLKSGANFTAPANTGMALITLSGIWYELGGSA